MADVVRMSVETEGGPLRATRIAEAAPGRGEVRVTVVATGVCGADVGTVRGARGSALPVTPGHEVGGVIAELGEGVAGWDVGERVAVGWFGGSCGHCAACRRGDLVHCPDRRIPGRSYPGGWAQSITVPATALARVPDGLDLVDAAPMGCAGVTTFNALRHAGVRPGARVAILGLGGLGHLAVQFADAMGFEVVVIARGPEKAADAADLGADAYVDADSVDPGAVLKESGGVDLIVSTVPATSAVEAVLPGLRPRGRLVLLGVAAGTLPVPVGQLVMNAQSVSGHVTGTPSDTEAAMRFALRNGIRPWAQRMPLEDVQEAVDRLAAGDVRYRIVLDTGARL
ncbi:zinc-binding dehydrogenase [Dietzia aurantiaca]|uniref:zinc-binding dehydrogenase n=1 Tax=Dietzia aurantiaca TaxID=983873 RepID=UPI001E623FC1|nr:alcohol dehydrogenase catalytic domain-containing protein [Dietzia aurantiaca]